MTKSPVGWEPVRYCVDTDTMAIEVRPWPGQPDELGEGEDAGLDLVIHYYPAMANPGSGRSSMRRNTPSTLQRRSRNCGADGRNGAGEDLLPHDAERPPARRVMQMIFDLIYLRHSTSSSADRARSAPRLPPEGICLRGPAN
jgi:hypothetical protein